MTTKIAGPLSRQLLACASILAILIHAPLPTKGQNPMPAAVQFDSFHYTGTDPYSHLLPADGSQFLNPIIAGFYPDPSLCRVGNDFYLVNSTFAYFPCIPIWHSTDLVHWKQLGNVIDRPSQIGSMAGLHISEGMYAPTIRHHASKFYVICTLIGGKGNFFVTADQPQGPWSDPTWLPDIGGIDPSLFFDESNNAYVVHNGGPPDDKSLYNGHHAIWIRQIDLQTGRAIGEKHLLVNGGTDLSKHPSWIEGPHLFKHKDFYYLIAAEGGTEAGHSEVVFRSRDLLGPYVPYSNNPILTQRDLPAKLNDPFTCTGHADFVQLPNGDWWSVFLGCRPYEDGMFNTGRETFLHSVQWTDGWPIILPAQTPLPRIFPRPPLPPATSSSSPTTGSFDWNDSFDQPTLDPRWLFIRTPSEKWYSLNHALRIEPRPVSLSSTDNPSFIGIRQQHATFSASIAITINPATPDCDAGLAAFQNEGHWFFLGINTGQNKIFLEQMNASDTDLKQNPAPDILATAPVQKGQTVQLKIEGNGRLCNFWFKSTGDWINLKSQVDASTLSTIKAGGFQGVTLGMFARSR
jgi:alpha-N-arabinofuranosidase